MTSNTNAASNNRPLSKEALAAIPVLRSLIISEKGTSSLKRILADYCREEGEPLPFRKFGFPSAVEYLKATGEFVLRTHIGGETSIFVKPKADTAHIQKMVAAQKPAKAAGVKQKNQYHWNNPQYRFRTMQGSYQPKPKVQQPSVQQQQQFKNANNPLKRFFPSNSSAFYPKISVENVPPKPANPPKVVPTLTNVVTAVKVEPRETKPTLSKMNENVPPQPTTVTQQAFVRPMPNNSFVVKRESPLPSNLSGYVIQSAPKNFCPVQQNQNTSVTNPVRFVQPSQQPSTNSFTGTLPPPGFNYRTPAVPAGKPFILPAQSPFQPPNISYPSNPFKPNYQPQPPQQHQFPTNNRVPFGQLQQQQLTQTPPPPLPPSDPIIDLLDQQVQMLHNSVKSFKTSYQQSRVLLNQEVEMMEAIVRQYQRTVSDQQQRQQAAVDRLNQQLELLHATCRQSHVTAGSQFRSLG